MFARFSRYLQKVFNFGLLVAKINDSRPKPRIAAQAIWSSAFAMAVLRSGSLNAIESALRQLRRLEKFVGPIKPSADTIGRVMARIDPEILRATLRTINHRLARNKVFANSWPLRFAAVDGHEFFASRHRCCQACNQRSISVNGRAVIEYYHRAVVCHLIGFDLAAPLDLETIQPGEDEVAAASRLIRRICKNYPHFFDAFVADALYFQAPFMNLCLALGKQVVTVMKGEHRSLLLDAQGLFRDQEPKIHRDRGKTVTYWEEEGFDSAAGVGVPLRVLHTMEREDKRQRIAGRWLSTTEEHSWWWQTTIPIALMSAPQLWAAAHRRWDIENDLFNTLVTHWSLNHCFKHHPVAIENFVLTLFVAFVMLQSFYLRNLKPAVRNTLTLIALSREFYADLAAPWCAPWLLAAKASP